MNTGEGTSISPEIIRLSYRGMFYHASSYSHSFMVCRTCTVGANTLIGSHSQISDNVVITSSVIGRRCKILPGAKVANSYIFDDTTIEADCVITSSIIGSMVKVKEGTVIEKGCLIADEVIVGPKGLVKEFERVSKKTEKTGATSGTDDEDEDSELEDIDEGQHLARARLATDPLAQNNSRNSA